ncbi:type 1 glutamine amidotransferase domain-containing protein [candidate division GN15 bacterium]|nr:type 1 glutamine amidotransferase domain-containing protein [candidate division GN15 bacterium]
MSGKTAGNKVLIVVTSHGEMGDTGKETGFWMSEMTHPYKVITDAGYEVDIASIEGGKAPIDPRSIEGDNANDPANKMFLDNPDMMAKISNTMKLSDVTLTDYRAIVFAGGHGTMWDFPNSKAVQKMTAKMYESGGVVGAVCHGPAALVNVTLSDGTPLLKGKKVTAFTNEEEVAVELDKAVPFMLETKMKERGATFSGAGNWQSNVVVDGRLVTGQNPASAHELGKAVVRLLEQK